jgi:hypothetical protein
MNFLPAEMREDAKMRPSRTGYIGWCATIKYGIGRGLKRGNISDCLTLKTANL